jgi:hypothetical protein
MRRVEEKKKLEGKDFRVAKKDDNALKRWIWGW